MQDIDHKNETRRTLVGMSGNGHEPDVADGRDEPPDGGRETPPDGRRETPPAGESTRPDDVSADAAADPLGVPAASMKHPLEDDDYVVDPSSVVASRVKRKVPARIIDRVWRALPADAHTQVERVMAMCAHQTIQRYAAPAAGSRKMLAAQELLQEAWLSREPASFALRLHETALPAPVVSSAVAAVLQRDYFDADRLLRTKKNLESHLLAEWKQLAELERTCSSVESVLALDQQYLGELRATTSARTGKMQRDTAHTRQRLGLADSAANCDRVRPPPAEVSSFDPDHDPDTAAVLELLERHLASIAANTAPLAGLNRDVEQLWQALDEA